MSIKRIFNGDTRTSLVKKNIAGSLAIKGWSCMVQFLLVPITLKCLNQYEYGIWLTINSILLWIDQFDIGLGNGLRNKLAESLANGDKKKAKSLVSSTFFTLFIIVIPIVLILTVVIYTSDLYTFMNINKKLVPNLNGILVVSMALVGATFIFKFIGNVYLGLQLPAINNLLIVSGQTLALVGIFILSLVNNHSMLNVAIFYTLSPLLVYLFSYHITFTKYRFLRPAINSFDKFELNGLFSLGIRFFIVQIAGLLIFASSNILITKLLSPNEVTTYQISYRYFSIIIMLFTIISAPLWSATTDAYAKSDWAWINKTERKMKKITVFFMAAILILFLMSETFYGLWVGHNIRIGYRLSLLMAVYMGILVYSTCYSNFLFGIGKIRLLTVVTVIEAVLYIPLAIWLGKISGLQGIVLSLILVNILCMIFNKVQFVKLSKHTASGIWDK